MNKKNILNIVIIMFILLLAALGGKFVRNNLTYVEFKTFNTNCDSYININQVNSTEMIQEINLPYDLLKKICIKVDAISIANNPKLTINLVEKNTGKVIHTWVSNANEIINESYLELALKRPIEINRDNIYELKIKATYAQENSSINFYTSSDTNSIENSNLYINGIEFKGDLSLKIYGGDIDFWWIGFYIFFIVVFAIAVIYCVYLKSKKKMLLYDKVFHAIFISIVVFILLCICATGGSFTDEKDNIRGAMIIARGGVIYRDYVTQHTPFVYYLSSCFAKLGASSIQQFRLSYYLFIAIVWGLLYIRNVDYFGKVRLVILPILEIIIVIIMYTQGYQVLSDNVQGICMIGLLLEYLRYRSDKKLGWSRSIIVSICTWGSIGSAFVSVYALVILTVGVLFLEIMTIKTNGITIKKAVERYWKLCFSLLLPLLCVIGYFTVEHTLERAFMMAYKFNIDVYSKYIDGFGNNKLMPFYYSIRNVFNLISTNINLIMNKQASTVEVLQVLIILLVTVIIIRMFFTKQITLPIFLFTFMCCCSTRGQVGFHGIPFWNIAILIIVLYVTETNMWKSRKILIIELLLFIFLVQQYILKINIYSDEELSTVSVIEQYIVSITDEGEAILIDTYSLDSIYLLKKNRYPVNRNTYFLPWYMEWFEQDTINDLDRYKPRVVIYNQDVVVWSTYYNFCDDFKTFLQNSYTQISTNPDEFAYKIWLRND